MRVSEFDSSDEEDGGDEESYTPLQISWLSLQVVECSQFLGICPLPGCRYKEIRRNMEKDVDELCAQGVQDVFVLCERAELVRYRVPGLLECYTRHGLSVHHLPFPDGGAPELHHCTHILDELQHCLHTQRRTVIHCYGGLGRSGLIAACLLLQLSISMTPTEAIEILRELRGGGAIQTVKQYNFLQEFREKLAAFQENRECKASERSVSR
ncbi:cyclin-dependent kinase inhibitor 3 isoform 1-T2 [Clarias gariepinus]|uniref:cyclin-dependent kinase inhibitor 3 n=1 Tax=Clarias gariepinus TaxID=13013 RepID=UPI00234C0BC2|nr:cyclin-dependent kinase inhibitor 3 [Clarias gariepinus]XP_053357485.1 cyclin-dependent kinase inhibitor 3 [Clarias gariepinus]